MKMLVVLLAVAGCSRDTASVPTPKADPPEVKAAPVDPAADADALVKANEAAGLLGTSLKQRILQEMADGGPVAAIAACSDEAQALTAQVRGQKQVAVGRASTKLRNPNNSGPEWVKEWLAATEGTPAAEATGLSEVVNGPNGRVARVIKPIAVEAPCLTCHGAPEAIPEDVKAVLAERYPKDQATGYAVGDLRGALWAEARVASATP
ncbi:MAG: DUF3365 domain-containing protein [Alphaproteobacteria bacterium]|nr:DUF3365 domain-containing protein [Alphaproteobacteria bacterium]